MVTLFLTSALMVIVILIIRFLFKNKLSFLILYPLWGLVLLRLLVPVTIIESPLSIMNLVNITDNKKNVQPAKEEKTTINNKPEENKNNNKTNNKNTTKQFINKNEKNTNINSTVKNNIIITSGEPDIKNIEENIPADLAKTCSCYMDIRKYNILYIYHNIQFNILQKTQKKQATYV